MTQHWTERLVAEAEAQGLDLAALDRRAGIPDGRARHYKHHRTDHPRGDVVEKYAAALGVELLWLRDGVPPMRAGAAAPGETAGTGDEVLARRDFATRIQGGRRKRGFATVEAACITTSISPQRWRQIEAAQVSPTLVELQALSDRLRESTDWLVCGILSPREEDAVAVERARATLQDGDVTELARAIGAELDAMNAARVTTSVRMRDKNS